MLKGRGVQGLLDLFDSVGRLMKPALDHSLSLPALNKNSVLGLYIRRVIIFFEKLPFDQVVALYEALKKYLDRRVNTSEGSDISTGSKTEDSYLPEYVLLYMHYGSSLVDSKAVGHYSNKSSNRIFEWKSRGKKP